MKHYMTNKEKMKMNNQLLITSVRYVGCTRARHRALGAHAGINARAGELWRNDIENKPIKWRKLRSRVLRECKWCGQLFTPTYLYKTTEPCCSADCRGCCR